MRSTRDAAPGRRLPAKDAAAAMRVRIPPFLLEQLCKGRAGDAAFEPARLVVEALQRGKFFIAAEPGRASHRSRALHDCKWCNLAERLRLRAGEPADRVSQSHDPEILISHVADLVSQHAGKLAQVRCRSRPSVSAIATSSLCPTAKALSIRLGT